MKYLMLMRHGEAEDPIGKTEDADWQRPLTGKGRHDMSHLRGRLLENGLMPQFVIASDAVRTHTSSQIVTGDDYEGVSESTSVLYNAKLEILMNVIKGLDDHYQSALIVGHNPGVYEAVLDLVDQGDVNKLREKTNRYYKSGTLTVLECFIDKWADLTPQKNKLHRIFIPN